MPLFTLMPIITEYLRVYSNVQEIDELKNDGLCKIVEMDFYPMIPFRVHGRLFMDLLHTSLAECNQGCNFENYTARVMLLNQRMNEGIERLVMDDKVYIAEKTKLLNLHEINEQMDYQAIIHTMDGWMVFNPRRMPPSANTLWLQ